MNFMDKTESKKGAFGESLVDDILENRFSIYTPKDHDSPHPIDRLMVDKNTHEVFGLDVKSKSKRKLHDDTGIDMRHYKTYFDINKTLKVFLIFVDEDNQKIYGNKLDNLLLDKARKEYGIVYFKISDMKHLGDISDEDAATLRSLTTKQDKYKPDEEMIEL